MVWCVEDEHGDEDGDRGDQMHCNAVSSPGSGAVDHCEDECEDENEEEAQPSEDRQRRSAGYLEQMRVVRSSASSTVFRFLDNFHFQGGRGSLGRSQWTQCGRGGGRERVRGQVPGRSLKTSTLDPLPHDLAWTADPGSRPRARYGGGGGGWGGRGVENERESRSRRKGRLVWMRGCAYVWVK